MQLFSRVGCLRQPAQCRVALAVVISVMVPVSSRVGVLHQHVLWPLMVNVEPPFRIVPPALGISIRDGRGLGRRQLVRLRRCFGR
jgi:hypothetical protein